MFWGPYLRTRFSTIVDFEAPALFQEYLKGERFGYVARRQFPKEADGREAAAQGNTQRRLTKAMGWLALFGNIIMFDGLYARICKKREEILTSLLSAYTFYSKSRCIPPIISYSNNPDILLSKAK